MCYVQVDFDDLCEDLRNIPIGPSPEQTVSWLSMARPHKWGSRAWAQSLTTAEQDLMTALQEPSLCDMVVKPVRRACAKAFNSIAIQL